ncbi:MAG: hypothetical protein RL459_1768, partial [Pseudomonadota bacterium]
MTKVQVLDKAAAGPHAIVVGGGPAGLMAAEVLSSRGVQVDLYDAMPSVGRKFLLAGKGGLNLTHSEPLDRFVTRYGARQSEVSALLHGFEPEALRAWAQGRGVFQKTRHHRPANPTNGDACESAHRVRGPGGASAAARPLAVAPP